MRPAVIIPLVLVLLTMVVVALPLLMSAPESTKQGSHGGHAGHVGIVGLQYAFINKEYPVITRVIDESPAALAGISKDDLLLSVGHKNASMMGDFDIHQELCGDPNSSVQVTIKSKDGSVLDRNLMRIQTSDLPKEADSKYLDELAQLSQEDFLLRRDATAKPDDFSYTSLIMHSLHQGPVVLEFFADETGASPELGSAIEAHNKKDSLEQTANHMQITLLSCDIDDKAYRDLIKHFKVTAGPTYVFVPGNRGVILSRNIERGPLSAAQIKSRLADLLYEAKQPIPQIHTAPAVVGPEIEEQNSSYTPIGKSRSNR
ncbi:MAG: PDZ domain-containing protein [Candidatus Obscuribacterales bacterium]